MPKPTDQMVRVVSNSNCEQAVVMAVQDAVGRCQASQQQSISNLQQQVADCQVSCALESCSKLSQQRSEAEARSKLVSQDALTAQLSATQAHAEELQQAKLEAERVGIVVSLM